MGTLASGSIDLKSLKVAGEPNKYITYIDSTNGIRIYDTKDNGNYVNFTQINSNGLQIYKGGTSDNNRIANFGTSITLGNAEADNNKFNILITNTTVSSKGPGILLRKGTSVLNEILASGMNVYVDGDTVAQFGETVKIGKISSRQTNISVDRDGLKLNYTGWYGGPLNTTTTAIVCGIYGYAGSPIVEKQVARIPGNVTVTLQYIPTSGSQIILRTSSSAGTRILTTFTAGIAETYTSGCKVIYDGEKTFTFSKVTGRSFASAYVNVYYYTNEDSNRTKGGYITIGTSVDNPFINTLTIGSYLQTTRDQQLILGQYNEPDETAYITIGTGTSNNDLLNEFVIRDIKDLVLDTKAYTVRNDYNLENFWYPAPGAAQTINVYSSEDDSLITTIEKTASDLNFHLDSSYGVLQTDSIYYSYIPYSEGLGLSIGKNNQTGQYSIASGLNITTIGYGAIGHGLSDNDGSILSNGIGSLAQGYSTNEGLISTSGPGSIALGYTDRGTIAAQGAGSLSLGYNVSGGAIVAKERSSIALGYAGLTSKIISAGVSAIAGGIALGGTIITRTNASIAFGKANSGSRIITNGSTGSIAMGVAYNGYQILTDRIDNTDPMDGAYAMGIAYGGHLSAEAAGARAVNESTIAAKRAQTAMGSLNIRDDSLTTTHPSGDTHYGQYALIIGNGVVGGSRSNALTIDWNGNITRGDGGTYTVIQMVRW